MADMTASRASINERLRAQSRRLTGAAARISEVVRSEPEAVLGMTVTDLAQKSETSVGSVVRFAKELGFQGFQDLKLQLAGDLSSAVPHQDSQPLPGRILIETADALRQAVNALDSTAFWTAVEVLAESDRVLVSGVGTSQPVAADAAYRLQLAGIATISVDDAHRQHVAAALLRKGDACLTISHTGQTQETLTVTSAAREAGARTIAISSFAHSPLAQLSDVLIVAGSAETGYRVEAMTSRFIHLAVVDALFVAVAEARPNRAAATQERAYGAVAEHRL